MGETEEDGAKPLRQPKKDGSQKPIRQAENEIPVFALFAILANMDPRTMSELIAKKKEKKKKKNCCASVFATTRLKVSPAAMPRTLAEPLSNAVILASAMPFLIPAGISALAKVSAT